MIYRIYYIHNGEKQPVFTVQDTEDHVKEFIDLLDKNRSMVEPWGEYYYTYEPIKIMSVDELKSHMGI